MLKSSSIKSKSLKKSSVASRVLERISDQGEGTIWIFEDFSDMEFSSVAMILSRLSKKGVLKRIRPGVYYYPKMTVFGASKPNPRDILNAVLRRRHLKGLSAGVDVLNKLKITDQVSGVYAIVSDRRVSVTDIAGVKIKTIKRPLQEQEGIDEVERAVLDACRNIRNIPNVKPGDVIKRIKELVVLNDLNINRLIKYALFEPPRVKAIIGSIAEELQDLGINIRKSVIEDLRKSMNPLTCYKLGEGVKSALNLSKKWNIT